MLKKVLIGAFILSLTLGGEVFADSGAAALLKMSPGARATGMGGAFVAVGGDATVASWNPAGLADLSSKEVSFTYSSLSYDRTYNFINYVHPLGKDGTLGIGLINCGIADYERWSERNVHLGEGDYSSNAILLSYGRKLNDWIMLGGNVKYLSSSMDGNSGGKDAKGAGIDIAAYLKPGKDLSLGFVLADLGMEEDWKNTEYDVPLKLKLGLAYKPLKDGSLILATDFTRNMDENITHLNLGAEWQVLKNLAARVGTGLKQEDGENVGSLAVGIGYKFEVSQGTSLGLDYAYSDTNQKELDLDAHRVSLSVKF